VLIVDGQPLARLGVRSALGGSFEVEELPSRSAAIELMRDVGDFDVAIVDMRPAVSGRREKPSGPETIRELSRAKPGLGIVALGETTERHHASEAVAAGASAYVCKGAEQEVLRRAVEAALEPEEFVDPTVAPKGSRGRLTLRQRQILQLLAEGESLSIAARKLELGEETVKSHAKNILARLGAKNRAHAVAIGIRESMIE